MAGVKSTPLFIASALFCIAVIKCQSQCNGRDGLYANPNDRSCTTYLQCVNGVSSIGNCPYGQLFYPEINMCVDRSSYTCGNPYQCGDLDRNIAVPNDCRSYYVCFGYYGLKRTCSVNRVFNPRTGFCENGVNCPNDSVFSCPQSNGNFADPSDSTCSLYYECQNWRAIRRQCSNGYLFHPYPTVRRCLLADSVDCNNPNPFICPTANADYADPKTCSRFYSCQNSAPLHRTCPQGTIFVESLRRCTEGDQLTCVAGAPYQCSQSNGNFPDPTDATCRYYYECTNGVAKRVICPNNFRFHPYPTARRCLLPDSVDCNDPNPFVCPSANEDVLDPKNCSRFYSCQNYAPLHRTCPTGQIFKNAVKRCESGDTVRCV